MSQLTLTAAPAARAVPSHRLNGLPEACVRRFDLLLRLMPQCSGARHGDRRAIYARVAAGSGMDGETLRKLHARWQGAEGEWALIDHRLCKGLCNVATCRNKGAAKAVSPALAEEFQRRVVEIHALSHRMGGTRSMRQAWRSLLADLAAGQPLPGVGTWQQVWRAENPTLPMPPACPYGETHRPHGWSYQTFAQLKPELSTLVAAQRGIAAVMNYVEPVRMDWAAMRPQEFLIVDDHDFDFYIVDDYGETGRPQVARLSCLAIMDGSTRRVLWAQVFPKFTRPDGTRIGISQEDTQHLFANYFSVYGLPREWDTHIICENRTATLKPAIREALTRLSGGRIHVHTTGLHDGRVKVGGFAEATGGNPRGVTGALEKYWDSLNIALAHLPGQIGNGRDNKPGEAEDREAQAKLVIKRFGPIAELGEVQTLVGYIGLTTAKAEIMAAFAALDARQDHALEGFAQLTQWRAAPGHPWLSCAGPEMQAFIAGMGEHYVNLHLADPQHTQRIRESPGMKWARTRHASDYQLFTPADLAAMYVHRARIASYTGTRTLRVQWRGAELLFTGTRHDAVAGQDIELTFDGYNPQQGACLWAADGRYLGHADYTQRVDPHNREQLNEALGNYNQSLRGAIHEARQLTQPEPVLRAMLDRALQQRGTVEMLEERKAQLLPESALGRATVDAHTGQITARKAKPTKADADTEAEDIATKEARRRALAAQRLVRA